MTNSVYTLGVWKVKPGNEEAFVARWKELSEVFLKLPHPPPAGKGILIQSLNDSALFYSFGPWNDLKDIQEMRENRSAQTGIAKLRELCIEAQPGSYKVVATG